jgi:hypothetical protein
MNPAMARVARARQALGTPVLDPGLMDQAVRGSSAPVSPISSWNSDVEFIQRRLPNRAAAQQGEAGREALDGMLPSAAAGSSYQAPVGAVPHINATRLYQQEGRGRLAGLLNNPFDEQGRRAILRQVISAPGGGHIRSALQGQEVFGHTITNAQARMAEQATVGVLATGVGSWGLLSAIDALNGDNQTPGTMPMV